MECIVRIPCSKSWLAGVLLAAVIAMTSAANAAPLSVGTALIPAPAEFDPVGGSVLSTMTVPFAAAGSFSGTLTTEVISGDTTNALGGLTFTYLITNDVSSANSIGRMSVTSFDAFVTDSNYQVPANGVAPASIDRNVSGDVIGFNFVPTALDPASGFLAPGMSSVLLVVQTNAAGYSQGVANFIDGGVATATTIVPIPEPGSVALALSGLIALSASAFRRR
jgi:hypothetical protein